MKSSLKNCLLRNNRSTFFKEHDKFFLILVMFLVFLFGKSQVVNYVSNPSFETALPSATFNPVDAAKYWSSLDSTLNASYYIISKDLGTAPNCSFGFQFPRTGKSFALSSFYCNTTCGRWYPRNRLKRELKPNTAYCAKYFVVNTNNNRIAIDSYGAYFGNTNIDTITQASIPLTYLNPQIENTNGIITDTLHWIPVTGTFVANGTEKYMILGNFKSNVTTNTLLINTPTLNTMTNDVYIDDVSLIELNLPAFAGHDTTCIPGSSVYIGRARDIGIDEDCMWYKLPNTSIAIDTAAGIWVNPISTSTYMVRQEICGLVKWDTVIIYEDHVGLEKLNLITNELNIFPVPAGDYVELRIANEEWMKDFDKVSILNSLGLKIREEEIHFEDKSVKIKTNDLPNGVYSIVISNTQNETVTKKLLIAK